MEDQIRRAQREDRRRESLRAAGGRFVEILGDLQEDTRFSRDALMHEARALVRFLSFMGIADTLDFFLEELRINPTKKAPRPKKSAAAKAPREDK